MTAVSSPLLKLDHVDKTYSNGTVAVRDVNLSIGDAEFVSILGPSGCGKSTLLRLVAGLGDLSGGRVSWPSSADVDTRPDELGFVFQEPTLMPWASVADNVYLPLQLAGVVRERARARIEAALESVGLLHSRDEFPRALSGGMRMRVSIARALITRPQLLLMDEPFAALDEITRLRLNNDLLKLWHGHGWTVMFVTHSVYESVYLSSRVIVMAADPGRVVNDIVIDEPFPRTESYRTSERYNAHCRTVSAALKQAMEQAHAQTRA